MPPLASPPPGAQLSAHGQRAARRVQALLEALGDATIPSPSTLAAQFAVSVAAKQRMLLHRRQIQAVLDGDDRRLLVVVGPCSVHDPVAMLEYAERLSVLAERVRDQLLICLRVYFDKPRTSVGWKGFINDPHLDGRCDVATGLRAARALLCELAELKLPLCTELLDPMAARYLVDLLSWAAVGARTSESQPHRELASGLPFAVGLKNPTCGDIDSALGGLRAIAARHRHLGLDGSGQPAVVDTPGNPNAHLVLRGGRGGPNCDATSISTTLQALRAAGLPARVVIDANHGNSNKQPERQPEIVASIVDQLRAGQRGIRGVMLESHLVAGNQRIDGPALTYGQSITDGCLGMAETEALLLELAGRMAELTRPARNPPCDHRVVGQRAPAPS